MTRASLAGWTPYRAAWLGDDMIVDWCHHGAARFTEPFYYETVVRAFTRPFNQLFQRRTLADDLCRAPPGLKPSGFIFHMSRCGSTLLGQALARNPVNVVVSEAAPIRNILQAPFYRPVSPERQEQWLHGVVNAFGQKRFPQERNFFVKFLAADVLDLPLISKVFPDVPWVFLYRDPLEILASQRALGGADTMKGAIPPQRVGLTPEDLQDMPHEAYLCQVMAAFGQAALAGRRPGLSLMIEYSDLERALFDVIPAHFGFAPDEESRLATQAALAQNSKRPTTGFSDDSAIKRAAAAPFAELVNLIVGPTYAALRAASSESRCR
jgi:hypothetical protein